MGAPEPRNSQLCFWKKLYGGSLSANYKISNKNVISQDIYRLRQRNRTMARTFVLCEWSPLQVIRSRGYRKDWRDGVWGRAGHDVMTLLLKWECMCWAVGTHETYGMSNSFYFKPIYTFGLQTLSCDRCWALIQTCTWHECCDTILWKILWEEYTRSG